MDKRQEREAAARIDRSSRGEMRPGERVQALLDLADHLQVILVPVNPDPRFRGSLRGELILAAQQRPAESRGSVFRQHRRGILIGAALGSIASILGVLVAKVLRQRHSRAPHAASG